MRAIAGLFLVVVLTACSAGGAEGPNHSPVSQGRTGEALTSAPGPSSEPRAADHRGSLTAGERSLATALARRAQRKVIGTFIGATAFVTRGTPFDPGSVCDVDRLFLDIRLVWKADANFTHSHPPGSPSDGPRKSLLMTVDPATHDVCESGAAYRHVGASDRETLLYGEWPGKAAGHARPLNGRSG